MSDDATTCCVPSRAAYRSTRIASGLAALWSVPSGALLRKCVATSDANPSAATARPGRRVHDRVDVVADPRGVAQGGRPGFLKRLKRPVVGPDRLGELARRHPRRAPIDPLAQDGLLGSRERGLRGHLVRFHLLPEEA